MEGCDGGGHKIGWLRIFLLGLITHCLEDKGTLLIARHQFKCLRMMPLSLLQNLCIVHFQGYRQIFGFSGLGEKLNFFCQASL